MPCFFVLMIVWLAGCGSANKTVSNKTVKPLSEKEMQADFDAFGTAWQAFADSQATTHINIDSLLQANKNSIADSLSYRDFYNLLWNVIDHSGIENVALDYPDSVRYLMADWEMYFPLPLVYKDGGLYTDLLFKHMPADTRILSVNGLPADIFVKQTTRYALIKEETPEQENDYIASDKLPQYVYLSQGKQSYFDISYILKGQNDTASYRLLADTQKAFYENYQKSASGSNKKAANSPKNVSLTDNLKKIDKGGKIIYRLPHSQFLLTFSGNISRAASS